MEQFRLWGTIVNALAVIAGSLIGLLIKRFLGGGKKDGGRMETVSDTIFKGVALCVLAIGITGTIKAAVNDQITGALQGSYAGSVDTPLQLVSELAGEKTLIIIISMVVGALIGQLIDLDRGVNRLGAKVEDLARARFGTTSMGTPLR